VSAGRLGPKGDTEGGRVARAILKAGVTGTTLFNGDTRMPPDDYRYIASKGLGQSNGPPFSLFWTLGRAGGAGGLGAYAATGAHVGLEEPKGLNNVFWGGA